MFGLVVVSQNFKLHWYAMNAVKPVQKS